MKVAIAVHGKFHAFRLAGQLERLNVDYRLISSHYTRENLSEKNVITYPLLKYISWASSRMNLFPRAFEYTAIDVFKKLLVRQIRKYPFDILHSFSGLLNDISKNIDVREKVSILDCGSSYFRYGQKLIEEEYRSLGMKWYPLPSNIVDNLQKEAQIADRILIPSEFVKNSFLQYGFPEEKLIVVPYGTQIHPQPKRRENQKFTILFVGGNTARKGLRYLLQAFSEMNLKNAQLWIVGKPTKEVLEFAKKFPGDYAFFGTVSVSKLIELYTNASIFVLPSIEEGSALATYEAMAYGLPCIVSTNTGAVTRDGKDGFVVPIRDVKALKEKIRYCYENPSVVRQLSKNARSHMQNYTWEKYGERVKSVYEQVI